MVKATGCKFRLCCVSATHKDLHIESGPGVGSGLALEPTSTSGARLVDGRRRAHHDGLDACGFPELRLGVARIAVNSVKGKRGCRAGPAESAEVRSENVT